MKKEAGISRLELAIGTTVFAVLLGSFLPRFLHVQDEARAARLLQAYGEVSAAIRTTHATALTRQSGPDSLPCGAAGIAENRLAGNSTLCINGILLETQHGYPASRIADDIPGVLALVSFAHPPQGKPSLAAFIRAGLTYQQTGQIARIGLSAASDPKQCFFEYTEPLTPGSAAALGEPVTTGC